MSNPVVVEVARGETVESLHRGSVAVVDDDGKIVFSVGDIERPVYPRSAVKAIQALPLIETGAAEAYGFGQRELALAQASHGGEPGHVELAHSMLAAAGLDTGALECGSHWPTTQDATLALARAGEEPSALHNNCSGKHSAFLGVCIHCGMAHRGYVGPAHEFQALLRGVMEDVTGFPHRAEECGIDGCSIPTYAVPLENLAQGFARLATGSRLGPERAKAAKRLLEAGMAEPWYVAGTGRWCTEVMRKGAGRVFVKGGAEGVYCGAVPELGLGIALKCDDGGERAAETMIAAVLGRILPENNELAGTYTGMAVRPMENRNRRPVGEIRPAGPLA